MKGKLAYIVNDTMTLPINARRQYDRSDNLKEGEGRRRLANPGPEYETTERITDVSIVVKLRLWHSCPDGGPPTSSETSSAAGDHCLRGIPRASHDEGPTPV